MRFAATVFACYFIAIPGIYLLVRARLGASVVEAISTGFFFGFGLSVVFYLTLGRFFPIVRLDGLACILSVVALVLLMIELRRHPLPLWTGSNDRMQTIMVAVAMLFMLLFAFAVLTGFIDDDLPIHLPIIKRISMGDVPPHFPYFPSSLLRGHVGRDVFIGTIARFMDLRPEIALIYVTLALCPAYVVTAHSLAWRLARGERYPTCFCFFGLLFLVSFAIGPYEIRAGSITYVFNNNAFAFGYAFFFGWLIERIVSNFPLDQWRQAPGMRRAIVLIGLLAVAHTAQYFIYISNFLIFSIFIGALPFLLSLMAARDRLWLFVQAAVVVALAGISVTVLQLVVSPLFLERVLISLNLTTPDAPMGILQQARLTFPKPLPFSITAPGGEDVPFFSWHSLSRQGISFYLGLAGLFVGLRTTNIGIAGASLLGWLAMLWLLLVDMGEYRAEPLRLFLLAHIGFGASVGLMIGLGVQNALSSLAGKTALIDSTGLLRFRELTERLDRMTAHYFRFAKDRAIRSGPAIVLIGAIALCGWMARGSAIKFSAVHPLSLKSVSRMAALLKKDPENWNLWLRMRVVDFEAFKLLKEDIKRPSERLLLKISPDERFKSQADLFAEMTPMINASAMTGAGIVGVSQEHAPPHMRVAMFAYNYTASLFWQNPTVDLLAQLAPDWILLDPSQVPAPRLEQIKEMPGISPVWTLERDGGQRILLKYSAQPTPTYESLLEVRLLVDQAAVQAAPFELVEVTATIEGGTAKGVIKTTLLITDEDGKIANPMDGPIADAVRTDDGHYTLKFSMIQPGRWHVYFIDPSDGTRLNRIPLLVDVKG